MTKGQASTAKLTPEEICRAIYVDYEGSMDRPPSLLGWRIDGVHFGAIVEPVFAPCADKYRAKGNHFQDHGPLVASLIMKAERESRRIVSWSEHDWREMMAALDEPSLQERLCTVYRNAIKSARPWYRNHFGETPPRATLAHFLEWLGTPHPERYGQGKVGTGLRIIREQLETGRSYSELSPKARAHWVTVVKHNRLDLQGMERVLQATTEPWFETTEHRNPLKKAKNVTQVPKASK